MSAPPKAIWVPGALGMLGRAVVQELEGRGLPVVRSDRELPIEDPEAVARALRAHDISHVINCAAYTRVDDAEDHPSEAYAANARGPAVVASAAATSGAAFLQISTDYVFDGQSRQPYREEDACAPLGVYAKSKHEGERRVLEQLAHRPEAPVYVVRTSWLFGDGPCFPRTMLGLFRERAELSVVSDQRGRPTYAVDLARAVLELLRLSPSRRPSLPAPGLYHFANRGETSWHALALTLLEKARARGVSVKTERVLAIPTSGYPTRATRPPYSVLDTTKIERELETPPRPFEQALDDFLERELSR